MIRSLMRNTGRFLAAIVLSALVVCALEVGLRVMRVRAVLQGVPQPLSESLTQPSATTYLEPRPLLTRSENSEVTIRTSEWGTRGEIPIVPKPNGTFRVLCLGGQETFGPDIPEDATFCQRLAGHLQSRTQLKVEVINAGCPGAGPLCNLLRLRRTLVPLQADLILVHLDTIDLANDAKIRAALVLDAAGHPAYASHPSYHSPANPLIRSLREEFISTGWLLREFQTSLPQSITVQNDRWGQSDDISLSVESLRETQAFARATFATYAVSFVPDVWSMQAAANSATVTNPVQQLREALRPVASQGELVVVDPLGGFRTQTDPRSLFSKSGQLSAAGHALYAQLLAEQIVKQFPSVWTGRPAQAPSLTRESSPLPHR